VREAEMQSFEIISVEQEGDWKKVRILHTSTDQKKEIQIYYSSTTKEYREPPPFNGELFAPLIEAAAREPAIVMRFLDFNLLIKSITATQVDGEIVGVKSFSGSLKRTMFGKFSFREFDGSKFFELDNYLNNFARIEDVPLNQSVRIETQDLSTYNFKMMIRDFSAIVCVMSMELRKDVPFDKLLLCSIAQATGCKTTSSFRKSLRNAIAELNNKDIIEVVALLQHKDTCVPYSIVLGKPSRVKEVAIAMLTTTIENVSTLF
jgi:hypothetical protein